MVAFSSKTGAVQLSEKPARMTASKLPGGPPTARRDPLQELEDELYRLKARVQWVEREILAITGTFDRVLRFLKIYVAVFAAFGVASALWLVLGFVLGAR